MTDRLDQELYLFKREKKRQQFMAKFGETEAAMQRALDNVANAKCNWWLERLSGKWPTRINDARDHLRNAQKLLDIAKSAAQGKVDEAKRQARKTVDAAQKIHRDYLKKQELESKRLRLQLQQLKNSSLSARISFAKGVLEAAKNNNTAFLAAQAGLDAINVVKGGIYDMLRTMIEAAATLCSIRVVKLRGTTTARPEQQSAFQIYLERTLVGQDSEIDLVNYPASSKSQGKVVPVRPFLESKWRASNNILRPTGNLLIALYDDL
ncbi:uncharacterized protein BP01DRAFT_397638 [Aspergillus saccharolyticus JOP 1030-1]|uniref:Uncharacterized protein n=1 Tax=Aspergillus saccharolyticus JOP 1030-1 TaxID=1450539 RepID=A0A318ZHC2_9EURO|nr:hypothetical protein BP01DRAFT_397638 [Aspergillus saccharolyticus JOP 1030-1]PYH46355.1 hypothetical protein BP01DRAFT_397638 [Aspergillus saccharolyticus JOP 1030-1]